MGVSAVDSCRRTIWIADAHRGDRKRFVARADEKLTAFLELESAIPIRQNAQRIMEGMNKARQTVAHQVKTFSVTSSDVSTYLRHG
jgi:hypothetical protein